MTYLESSDKDPLHLGIITLISISTVSLDSTSIHLNDLQVKFILIYFIMELALDYKIIHFLKLAVLAPFSLPFSQSSSDWLLFANRRFT